MHSWLWGNPNEPIDLTPFVIRPMNHQGDSEKWIARPHKKPRLSEPLPEYLIKRGEDAINERISSWLAERYDVPHQVGTVVFNNHLS